jgi:hypothetical protein
MKKKSMCTMLAAFVICFAGGVWMPSSDFDARAEKPKASAVPWAVPTSLKLEHEHLHAELLEATKAGGQTADAAKEVAKLLHRHFEKEEEYALPPLGLLTPLADGSVTPEMRQVIAQTDKLKDELPQMLKEHKDILVALEELAKAAQAEGKPEHARFAEKLKLHAKTEEEILYPAAVLIGEYLKLKFQVK